MSEGMARRKVILISPELLRQTITEGYFTEEFMCSKGLPPDAAFVRGYYDPQQNCFGAVFEHPDWELVVDGELLPFLDVEFRRPVTLGAIPAQIKI